MKWSNVRLIFARELRDQLRDRRTFFMVAVLPLLLYPLLGMSIMQVTQFLREHPSTVWVIGAEHQPESQPLLDGDKFARDVCPENESQLLKIGQVDNRMPAAGDHESIAALAAEKIHEGLFDVVVIIRGPDESAAGLKASAERIYVSADDKSRIAHDRVGRIVNRWNEAMKEEKLKSLGVPVAAAEPVKLMSTDVSRESTRRAAIWAKLLPLIVLIWALTGAFYPAVDLCAGEKERGTLETLLCSPAGRSEIVWGKLLAIMMFSIGTSLLNLASIGVTGSFIARQLSDQIGSPPLAATGWLVLALIPMSALFSSLALAIAAFARSSKEGQYYLMPLLLITLPLIMLPMMPTAELTLGTSLVPVTGMILLLRTLVEGHYMEALRFAAPVIAVTGVCTLLAVRWAIDQFNNESVLFRESERFGVGIWLRHLVRDRGETPTFGEGILCGVILLMIQFFANLAMADARIDSWDRLFWVQLIAQVALIATPPALMAIILTRSPRRTLLLTLPRAAAIPAAILLAVSLHSPMMFFAKGIEVLYPVNEKTIEALRPMIEAISTAPLAYVLILIAVTPAICEEIAFRGFILSGLRHMGHKWAAIIISSVFFGLTHGILQQSLAACLVGVVLGYLAVQTGSLLPGVAFHMTYNGMSVLVGRITADTLVDYPVLASLVHSAGESYEYNWPVPVAAGILAILLLAWFRSLPYQAYDEETLQQALDHQTAGAGS